MTYEAVTEVEITRVRTDRLLRAFTETPLLAIGFLKVGSHDQAEVVKHLVSIGRRDAFQRTAHFFLELGERLRRVGLGDGDGYDCPLSQSIVADALGMTAVHLNRVLRHLREAGLLIFRDGRVTFSDQERLADMTEFELDDLPVPLASLPIGSANGRVHHFAAS